MIASLLTAVLCWGAIYLIVRWKRPSLTTYLHGSFRLPPAKAGKAAALIGAMIALVPLWMAFVTWPFLIAFLLLPLAGHVPNQLIGDMFVLFWIAAPVIALTLARRFRLAPPFLVSIGVAALLSLLISVGPM